MPQLNPLILFPYKRIEFIMKKYLISILIWVFSCIYLFFTFIFLIVLTYFMPAPNYDPFGRPLFKWFFPLIGSKVMVKGKENIGKKARYLFMINHCSAFDLIMLSGFIHVYVRGFHSQEHFKWPLIGWYIKRIGQIPINRKSATASLRILKEVGLKLRKHGPSIAIFPEGTRTRDGNLQEFKKLPFVLAKIAEVPIIIVATSGLFRLKPRHSWIIQPGPIKIEFSEPISVEIIKELEIEKLQKMIYEKMKQMIVNL